MKPAKAALLGLFFLLLSAGAGRANMQAELEEAKKAFYRYEYQAALSLFLPLAKLGDAQAQERVGEMYMYGMGVYRDCERAQEWLRKSADQKNARAAYLMGRFYNDDKCVNKDRTKAYMWYSVAETMVPKPVKPDPNAYDAQSWPLPAVRKYKNEEANKILLGNITADLRAVGDFMTLDQVAEAKQLAKDWKPQAE